MRTSASDGCRRRGELPSFRSWDGITSFLVSSDLVVYINAGLVKFVKYIGECNLVRQSFFEVAIEAFLKERDSSTFIET